jgi:hypothetical protein
MLAYHVLLRLLNSWRVHAFLQVWRQRHACVLRTRQTGPA